MYQMIKLVYARLATVRLEEWYKITVDGTTILSRHYYNSIGRAILAPDLPKRLDFE